MTLRLIAFTVAACLSGCAADGLQDSGQQLAGHLAVLALDVATDEQCRAQAVPGKLDVDGFCEMNNDSWIRNSRAAADRHGQRERKAAVHESFNRFMQEQHEVPPVSGSPSDR